MSGYFNWARVRQNFQLYKHVDELHDMYRKNRAQGESSGNSETDISGLINDVSCLGIYDLNIVGSGYAPLSGRLVEAATRPLGWRGIESELELLPGKQYLEERILSAKARKAKHNQRGSMYDEKSADTEFSVNDNSQSASDMMQQQSTHKTVLVFFVGGVTYSEIAAIRMLENRPNTPWKFIIGTTDIANGFNVVDGFVDQSFKDKSDNSYFNK